MLYDNPKILKEKSGNNAFAWEERTQKYGKSPTLTIPSLIEGGISDVQIGNEIVFEEIENGKLRSCVGLRNFVQIQLGCGRTKNGETEGDKLSLERNDSKESDEPFGEERPFRSEAENGSTLGVLLSPSAPFATFQGGKVEKPGMKEILDSSLRSEGREKPTITIFDNHNHALYFWIDAVKRGILQPGFTLIHIDEHSDLWENPNTLDLDRALQDEQYAGDFTNLSCNVGNYIQPAIESGLVGKIIRIENESQIDTYMNFSSKNAQEISQEQEIRGSKDFSKGVYPTVNEGEKSEADKEVRSSSGISTVLNIDLDIFSPELDFIPEDKKIRIIQNLLQQVDYVTIATSPFFIDQGTAIQKLQNIMKK